MTLTVSKIGVAADGTPQYHYQSDGIVVVTGPVKGPVTLSDGTSYDVSPDVIEVASEDHKFEVMHQIGLKHNADGHPLRPGFEYAAPEDGSVPRPGEDDAPHHTTRRAR